MIIYRPSDRIDIELGDLIVTLSPLTFEQKSDVFETQVKAGEQVQDQTKSSRKAIAYSVKDVKGAKSWDGEDFSLEFEGGKLSSDCVDVMMSIPDTAELIKAIGTIVRGEDIKTSGVKLVKKAGAKKNG